MEAARVHGLVQDLGLVRLSVAPSFAGLLGWFWIVRWVNGQRDRGGGGDVSFGIALRAGVVVDFRYPEYIIIYKKN